MYWRFHAELWTCVIDDMSQLTTLQFPLTPPMPKVAWNLGTREGTRKWYCARYNYRKSLYLMVHSSSVRWTQNWRSPCQLRGDFVGRGIMLYKDEPTSSYANYHVNLTTSAVRWTQLTCRIYVDSKTAFSKSTLYKRKWINWLGINVKGNLRWLYTSHAQSPLRSHWSSSSVANEDDMRHIAP